MLSEAHYELTANNSQSQTNKSKKIIRSGGIAKFNQPFPFLPQNKTRDSINPKLDKHRQARSRIREPIV